MVGKNEDRMVQGPLVILEPITRLETAKADLEGDQATIVDSLSRVSSVGFANCTWTPRLQEERATMRMDRLLVSEGIRA
eukprot:7856877-Pyramimonas_sp.AAC.1